MYAGGRGYLVRHTMMAMEARLDTRSFARMHRSGIVNVLRVLEIRTHGEQDYVVVLRDGTRLKMSRSYHDRLTLPP